MIKAVLVAFAFVTAAPVVHAQDPSPQAQKRRNQIQLMEGLLARAGSIAAETFSRQLQQLDPSMTVFIGQSRARGFVLDGYGIFFDVEVPELRGSVVWSQMMMQREIEMGNALAMLKRALQDMPDGPSRRLAQQAVRALDMQAGPLQQAPDVQSQDPAIRVNDGTVQAEPPAVPPVLLMKDPRREYRETVQRELIDAMLDYSLPMDVGPDEWLAVAARVSEAGQRGQTLMLRVKGSDLAIYAADKTRRDEIRSKVEVRLF